MEEGKSMILDVNFYFVKRLEIAFFLFISGPVQESAKPNLPHKYKTNLSTLLASFLRRDLYSIYGLQM
jgi:hypothetical protein